ncbi:MULTISPECIES: YeiH family protein [unclassified Candidatus Frackibacter]|uniref:YeiH family protein n=1 Tax=unclassified Candidatus Frackibacter TaxID=2648818 RepID=UPI0007922996|nr:MULTISPECIES: putative sulfate exporter family transporter [unclassified Candidatus Frackibacter]KXS45127.1 MAG: hypothetical protein AWU54_582 [Candidatus Frackibacter sp. T328-2]SDC47499.1 conserved hypothetical integral membrane protein [Candidatus Frackibacter sp. WG11]SEM81207.1 conserved hypothetical integral membrane protein [Candidatus Frackibacter sp. WG12]SFL72834.1 conserved hypothetical integral membrane protein [Candidatus Frackibacter sp. WG13]
MNFFKDKGAGLVLTIIIGIGSRYLSNWIPHLGGVTLAIIVGFLVSNIFSIGGNYEAGIRFVEKKILAMAIMLMGLKLELNILSQLGFSSILVIVTMVLSTIGLGYLIGRLLGLSKSFSILLGVGNGICGSSAIAAVAPVVSKNEEEIGLSISVVNLLGTLGIFILPGLTYALHLNDTISGLMVGSTLQATGQVVAAGFSISDVVGRLATVVKMGRILMLGPIVLGLNIFIGPNDEVSQGKVKIPAFIIGFFILSIVGTLHLLPIEMISYLKTLSKILLTIAMAGIGLRIKVSALTDQGPKALLVGCLIFISQLFMITGLITLLF